MTQPKRNARKSFNAIFIVLIVLVLGVSYQYLRNNAVAFSDSEGGEDSPPPVEPTIQPKILNPGLLPAFPGAEGAGSDTPGGRGGQVIEVTNLNDRGPGSLRAAVSTAGPRTVVFRVAGVIELERPLTISQPYLTLAGQTAPGGGITLSGVKNIDGEMIVLKDVHDVVIRYIRIRNGQSGEPGQGQTNIAIDSGAHHIVIDHVSLSWSLDENVMIHRNIPEGEDPLTWPEINRITIQRSLIAEGLHPHSTGIETGGEAEIEGWRGVQDITIHHNLFVHNDHRNPGVGSPRTQIINNVMYNWGSRVGETWRNIDVDWIANYFKPGPMSARGKLLVHVAYPINQPHNPWPTPSLFVGGNFVPTDFSNTIKSDGGDYLNHYANTPLPQDFFRQEPLPFTAVPVQIHSAEEAYNSVLNDSGANARLGCDGSWINNQDPVDQRLVSDVINGTGPQRRPISDASETGGLPPVDPGVACSDADHDGMPDEWELAHPALDPVENDAGEFDLHPEYTNLEVFLSGLSTPQKP